MKFFRRWNILCWYSWVITLFFSGTCSDFDGDGYQFSNGFFGKYWTIMIQLWWWLDKSAKNKIEKKNRNSSVAVAPNHPWTVLSSLIDLYATKRKTKSAMEYKHSRWGIELQGFSVASFKSSLPRTQNSPAVSKVFLSSHWINGLINCLEIWLPFQFK